MVTPLLRQVDRVSALTRIGVHGLDSGGLIVVAANVQALHAQAFFYREVLSHRAVNFLFLRRFLDQPVEILARNKVRQPDNGNPVESLFVGIVSALDTVLPPESLEWRYDEIDVSVNLTGAFLAHLDRVGNGI